MKKVILAILSIFCISIYAEEKIGIYDLRYTLNVPLVTTDGKSTAWDDVHTVATLQGVVNRDAPRLFVYFVMEKNLDIDAYWFNKYREEGEWLDGKKTITYNTIEELVSAYSPLIDGAVVYDENVASTSNVASAVAGIENLIAIRYDTNPKSLYSRLVLNGPKLDVKCWLVNSDGSSLFTGKGTIPQTSRESSHSVKNDPYLWFIEKYMKTGRCNTEYGAYYIDQYWKQRPAAAVRNHHTLTNHDFFVSKKAFFFDLSPWGDEPATDDPNQPVGTDLNTLKEMLLLAYNQNKGEKMCYIGGFPAWAYKYTDHVGGKHEDVPTEWEFGGIISAYNAFKDADAISYGALANSSFWQHFPLQKKYPQSWVSHQELKDRGLLTEDDKVNVAGRNFMIFYVGDYDASAWITQRTPAIWDDPERGKVPLMWSISPVLEQRAPQVMHNFRKTATANDYFASADNGAGYLMPGMLQEPREISGLPSGLNAWKNHCIPYYDRWDLSITGFIVDGYAPGLTGEGLDCYEAFSPNGIVPQKTPLASLHGNMPVLRADLDITNNDPKEAAAAIVKRIKERQKQIPFHWFRNILKTPSWYVQVMDEIKKQDPDIILLDAPAYFELLRIYLKNGYSDFAAGSGTKADPYLIETPEQLDAVRDHRDKHFKLAADIDMSDLYHSSAAWTPLGEWGEGDGSALRFSGSFDGNQHTIKSLRSYRQAHDLSLFGVMDGASIKNLIIEDFEITGEGRLGILCGAAFRSTIDQVAILNSKCLNKLSTHGSNAGGLSGPLYNSVISNSHTDGGYVYGKDCIGGIASSCNDQSKISNCYSTITVEGDTNVGGIVGKTTDSSISDCISLNKKIICQQDCGRIAGKQ